MIPFRIDRWQRLLKIDNIRQVLEQATIRAEVSVVPERAANAGDLVKCDINGTTLTMMVVRTEATVEVEGVPLVNMVLESAGDPDPPEPNTFVTAPIAPDKEMGR